MSQQPGAEPQTRKGTDTRGTPQPQWPLAIAQAVTPPGEQSERPRWGKLWRHGTSTSKPVQGIIHPGQIPTGRRQLGLLTWAAIK